MVTLPAGITTTATARVSDTTTASAHTLTVQCGNATANASFTVLTGTPAQGGLGGTQALSTAVMAAGGAMAALAAATGTFLLVRRARHNHP
ncbi:hypothetical protein ACIGBL_34755 [Streptomyces sp. NPDC085614]|uniref:hypothetical protein n=1 Tax=Streptomyces sp. NPDC085614 TaxID=3365733 RepID=UPI0037CEE08B